MRRHLVYICEICGAVLDEHHCKAQCPNCGRMLDCSDLPIFQANGTINDDAPPDDESPVNGMSALDEQPSAPPTTLTVRPSQELKALQATAAMPAPPKADRKGSVADLP